MARPRRSLRGVRESEANLRGGASGETEAAAETQGEWKEMSGLLGASVVPVTEGSWELCIENSAEIVLSFCIGSPCFSQQNRRDI